MSGVERVDTPIGPREDVPGVDPAARVPAENGKRRKQPRDPERAPGTKSTPDEKPENDRPPEDGKGEQLDVLV